MIRFIFRFLATIALALAVVMAVLDATRTVAVGHLVMTPLLDSWQATWPDGLAALGKWISGKLGAAVWDPGVVGILHLPGFVVFGLLALILYAVGRRPQHRSGRFVVNG